MSNTTQRWRPGPFEGVPGELDRSQLDLSLKAIFDHSYGLEQQATLTPKSLNGSAVAAGSLTVNGSVKAVATGLSSLSNIVGSVDTSNAPNNFTWSVTPSKTVAGAFDVYVFQPTSASVNTPVLATTPVTFRWHALGAP